MGINKLNNNSRNKFISIDTLIILKLEMDIQKDNEPRKTNSNDKNGADSATKKRSAFFMRNVSIAFFVIFLFLAYICILLFICFGADKYDLTIKKDVYTSALKAIEIQGNSGNKISLGDNKYIIIEKDINNLNEFSISIHGYNHGDSINSYAIKENREDTPQNNKELLKIASEELTNQIENILEIQLYILMGLLISSIVACIGYYMYKRYEYSVENLKITRHLNYTYRERNIYTIEKLLRLHGIPSHNNDALIPLIDSLNVYLKSNNSLRAFFHKTDIVSVFKIILDILLVLLPNLLFPWKDYIYEFISNTTITNDFRKIIIVTILTCSFLLLLCSSEYNEYKYALEMEAGLKDICLDNDLRNLDRK